MFIKSVFGHYIADVARMAEALDGGEGGGKKRATQDAGRTKKHIATTVVNQSVSEFLLSFDGTGLRSTVQILEEVCLILS